MNSSSSPSYREPERPVRIGFLALTDAAPFVVAQEHGLFAAHGVRVELRREIGWATIRDKVIYGELEAAHAPAPMLWSAQLGLNCPATDVLTAFVVNLHGNALTLSRALWEAGVRTDEALVELAQQRRRSQPLTFGVVFPYSSHHVLLRQWLRGIGLDPDHDVRIVVVPPAQMFRNLSAGTIDGFCAGEPWNTVAVRAGIGWGRASSAQQQPGHVEKVLLVTRPFAERRAHEHAAIVAALGTACAWCDEPQNREALAQLLSRPSYLNAPAAAIAPTLLGNFERQRGLADAVPDFHVFHRAQTNAPTREKADAVQTALVREGLLDASALSPELPRQLFREDLYREILHTHLTHEFATSTAARGNTHG